MKGIANGKIIAKDEILENKILLFNEKIIDIVDAVDFNEKNVQLIDAMGSYVSPGFIDIHIHGAGGADLMDGTMESLETIAHTVTKCGVTSFLPTTMTMSKEHIYKALEVVKSYMKKRGKGARVLGAHMEGPFISKKFKGAQKEDYILKPNFDFIKDYLDVIKIITLAPEEDENLSFVKKVKNENSSNHITLSIGHTNATYSEAMEAIEAGISHSTHTFNAMTPLHHREPGVVGAAMRSDITSELIADTIHVHPELFKLFIDIKGEDKVVLITDSMRAGCIKEGIYDLGGQKVIVDSTSARLENGVLAGSILTLDKALKNILNYTTLTIPKAVALLSYNPAKVINMEDKKGSIDIGKDADITMFDHEFNILSTIVEGELVFKK